MTLRVRPKSGTQILDPNTDLPASQWETSLIERILKATQSPQSLPFYRRAIAALGEGIVDQEYGELRYRTQLGEVNNPAKYFNALLKKRLEGVRNPRSLEELGSSGSPPRTNGRPPSQDRSYQSSSGKELFMELAPIKAHEVGPATAGTMQLPYSVKTIPWATFIGPEFFTLSTNKAQSDRVIARFRVLGGKITDVPLLRGRLFPKDQDRGILTAEDGRILGAIECLWVEQGCQYAQFGNGSVSGHCRVPIRRLAQLLGWRSFGGRDLDHLKRKVINLKVKGYYLELDAVEELRKAGMKGYGFTLIDGVELVDKTIHRMEQTILRICFSDPYTRQLLGRRVVSRPKNLLRMRSELAFVLRLYLEPILLSRGTQSQHSIELRNLIRLLNLPTAGWHKYKSRRQAVFGKAIRELHGMKTTSGHRLDIQIRQGTNTDDFMVVGRLVSNSSQDAQDS
jgi:hypothetical protein